MQNTKPENLISPQAADQLINAHDGDVALLYLHICRSGSRDREQAARVLCRTLREVEAAEEKLLRMGLLDNTDAARPAEKTAILPAEELPQYTAREIVQLSKADPNFLAIQSEAEKVMGKQLSSTDLRTLFGIYDHLALPPEVLLEMITFCGEMKHTRFGEGSRPSMHDIQKEAFTWVNRELLTLEQAEDYIRRERDRFGGIGRIKALLGIYGRELSSTEFRSITSWLDMGFDEEAISIAYDRTVTRTGGFKLNYMNKILQSWHDNKLHTASEIKEKDPLHFRPSAKASGNTGPVNLDDLNSILDKI